MYDARAGGVTAPTVASAQTLPGPVSLWFQRSETGAFGTPLLALGLPVFAAVWLGLLAFTSLSPPVDNIEQLIWVHSLEWGYYKHPPLPTWVIWLPASLLGASAWTSYVLGAALTLTGMWILWRLVSTLRGKTHAAVALLAALCITYYNGRLYYYNHNVVLLLLSAASAALCWQAFATRRLRWWAALGLMLGLAALTKYQAVVTMASILVFAFQQRAWRDPNHRRGVLLACLISLLVFTPHVYWLRTHDFGPIHYAVEASLGARLDLLARSVKSLHWLVDQLFNRSLPALLLLAAMAASIHRSRRPTPLCNESPPITRDGTACPEPCRRARALLLTWGFVPLLFIPLMGVAVGADPQLQWGTPFLLFVVPAAMELGPFDFWNKADLGKALRMFLLIQALLLVVSYVTSPRGPVSLQDHHRRTFDSAELATGLAASTRPQLGGPIRVVSGSTADAGAVALQLPEQPLVLIDGRLDRSPWMNPERVKQCGALEVGSLQALPGGRPAGAAFPGLVWHVTKPLPEAGPCPV